MGSSAFPELLAAITSTESGSACRSEAGSVDMVCASADETDAVCASLLYGLERSDRRALGVLKDVHEL